MKELHNHIFSKTTCISKETMLKYINKQLLDKEVHDVQKHLIDCEFCSEALEGMQYAEDSSALFSIDHKIDSMASGKKTPVIKNLMIAATILVLAFGTYFSSLMFNDVVTSSESNISMNTIPADEEKDKVGEIVPVFEEATKVAEAENSSAQVIEEIIELEETEVEVVTIVKEEDLYRNNNVSEPLFLADESPSTEQDNISSIAEVMDFEEDMEEGEAFADEIEVEEEVETEFKEAQETVTLSTTGNVQSRSENFEIAKTTVKSPAYKKRDKRKSEATAPVEQEKFVGNNKDNYGSAVGGIADEKNLENTVAESSDASTMDFDDISVDQSKADVTSDFINNGITYYEEKAYEKALAQFELSLIEKTAENNKALWFKALCLIELDRIDEAKTTLKKIVDSDFYLEATNKLKELE